MALKQWHRTAEMATSYTKMDWTVTATEKSTNTDSDMALSSICEMTGFKIQMRDICNPTKRTSLRTLTTSFLSSFCIQTKGEKSNQVILFYLQHLFSTYHWFGCFYYFLFNFFFLTSIESIACMCLSCGLTTLYMYVFWCIRHKISLLKQTVFKVLEKTQGLSSYLLEKRSSTLILIR